jgi:endonuclease YncB( thermonuclease family)
MSRKHLAELVAGQRVSVEWYKRDRFERIIGKVLVDGVDVCLEQVRAGMAWHFKKFEGEQSRKDREACARAEIEAREARRGLWRDPAPVAPWEYREWRARP